MNKGIIYALKNKAMPGLVKIGKTADLDRRLDDLYNTSVPYPFECIYAVEVEDMGLREKQLHDDIFYEERVNPKREFFEVAEGKVAAVLNLMGKNVTEKVREEINKDLDEVDKLISDTEDTVFYLKIKDCFAMMTLTNGKYTLKKDSRMTPTSYQGLIDNFPKYAKQRDQLLATSAVLKDGMYYLTEDKEFTSSSTAGIMVVGHSCDGPLEWKTEDGVPLKRFLESEN